MPRREAQVTLAGLFPLFIVYLVWGSTYLAIRIAVREGSGLPPFTMGAMRTFLAGGLLLAGAVLTRSRIRLTREEAVLLAASGLFLWTGGNGLVAWAEQRTDSGLAALLVGSTPMWVAVIESFLDRRPPSKLLVISLLTGFAGVFALSFPHLRAGVKADLIGVLAVLLAAVSWGTGSLILNRRPVGIPLLVSSAFQHLFGGAGFLAAAILLREPLPRPLPEAWWAWGYLVVFGSLVGFTAYTQALRLLPMRITMTYSYVNPVIAVFLGWLILREPVTVWTALGTALVLLGVAGVFRTRPAVKNQPR
ncbi:MAG: EamA family transporter [Firmicutes bacterium]|nr:EamA family transporter [Bacillota bacterium]